MLPPQSGPASTMAAEPIPSRTPASHCKSPLHVSAVSQGRGGGSLWLWVAFGCCCLEPSGPPAPLAPLPAGKGRLPLRDPAGLLAAESPVGLACSGLTKPLISPAWGSQWWVRRSSADQPQACLGWARGAWRVPADPSRVCGHQCRLLQEAVEPLWAWEELVLRCSFTRLAFPQLACLPSSLMGWWCPCVGKGVAGVGALASLSCISFSSFLPTPSHPVAFD